MARRIESIDVSIEDLEQLVDRAGREPLPPEGQRKRKAAVGTLGLMAEMLADKDTTIRKLRELLLPARTSEKTSKVCNSDGAEKPKPERERNNSRRKGHGRKGAADYAGAPKVSVAHPALKRGDHCPECNKGKLYPLDEPRNLIRIIGRAPVEATVYQLEALRCNLCGKVFTAPPPAGMGREKYDVTAVSMIALFKYGSGVPFYRIQKLESQFGIPLAVATQWQLMLEAAAILQPLWEELMRQAAQILSCRKQPARNRRYPQQGHLAHNDDTSMRILSFHREASDSRTGRFTSGIVSILGEYRIAVFLTGRKHAGRKSGGCVAAARRGADAAHPDV